MVLLSQVTINDAIVGGCYYQNWIRLITGENFCIPNLSVGVVELPWEAANMLANDSIPLINKLQLQMETSGAKLEKYSSALETKLFLLSICWLPLCESSVFS